MQPIPGRITDVACKGRPRFGALLDNFPIPALDRDSIRGEYPAVVRIAVQPLKYRSGFQRIHRHGRTMVAGKSLQEKLNTMSMARTSSQRSRPPCASIARSSKSLISDPLPQLQVLGSPFRTLKCQAEHSHST